MQLNINSDAVVKFTNKLEKMKKFDLPIAIRVTLNDAAFDVKQNVSEDAQKKAADFGAKKYDTLSTQAQAARTQAPNLDLALSMLNDPNMHQGLLHGVQDTWSRFKAAALGDKYANAPNEAQKEVLFGRMSGCTLHEKAPKTR